MMLTIRRHSLLFDGSRRIRPTHKVQRIMKKVLIVSEPANGSCNHQQRKKDKRRTDATPHLTIARQTESDNTPNCSTQNPSVVSGKHRGQNEDPKQKQAA